MINEPYISIYISHCISLLTNPFIEILEEVFIFYIDLCAPIDTEKLGSEY